MSIYGLAHLIGATLFLSLGVFTLVRAKKDTKAILFCLICLATFFWSAGTTMMLSSDNRLDAIAWAKVLFIGTIFFPVFCFHFILKFLEIENRMILVAYPIAFFFLTVLLATDYFIVGIIRYPWGAHLKVNPLINNPFLYFFLYLYLKGLWLLFKSLRKQDAKLVLDAYYRRKYVFLSFAIAGLVVIDFIPDYGINLFPFGFIFMILAFPLIAYSIVRYRLMGIKLFLSRTTVFAFLFSVASMLVYFPLFFWQRTLQDLLGKYWVFVPIFASFFVGISFIPFYRLMTKLTNRIFFQKRYEYHRLLNGLVEKISEADNVNKLLQSVSQTIWENIRPNKIGLLVFEPQEKAYVLRISKGENWLSPGFKMTENACLCKTLRMIKRPLMQTEIRLIGAKARQSFLKKEEWRRAEESFRQLKVSLCVPGFLKHKLLGIMLLDDKISGQLYDPEEIDLLFAVMEEMVSVMSDFQLKQEKDNLVLDTFLLISKTMEAKDEYTKNHIEDSSRYAQLFVHELKKLPDFKKIENLGQKLRTVALLHDLGKIGIPDRILNKKGPLSKKEYELIKRHCQIGASIISSVRSINKDIVEGIKYHQERYDGSGYPEGLKGKAIPPLARAVSVIDVYLALISERPYRKAMPPEKAIEIILSEKGRYFDPEVVEGFLKMLTSEFSPKPNLFHTASLA